MNLTDDFIFHTKEAFLNKEIDALMGDISFFFYYLEAGKQAVITSTITRTIQLVGKSNWRTLPQLTIGINRTGLFRFFYDTYLKNKLPPTTYTYLDNTYERIAALKEGRIDGLVAIDPFVATVLALPAMETIWHSNQIDACYVMWCFDQEFAMKYPEDIRQFHQALAEAQTWLNTLDNQTRQEYFHRYGHFSVEQAKSFAEFYYEPQQNYRQADFLCCQNWLMKNGELTRAADSTQCISPTFNF